MKVSNNHHWWPTIDGNYNYSYFIVACCTMLTYDYALTLGKEVDLIWRQRWSLMTLLYLSVRYMGIPYYIMLLLENLPAFPLTDSGCSVVYQVLLWENIILNAILWVIMITRLHAMYEQSRKMLIFLIVTSVALTIARVVGLAVFSRGVSAVMWVLSGTYYCRFKGDFSSLSNNWIIAIVWEVLALCLAINVTVKGFRELPRGPARSAFGDCFSALLTKTHIFYFLGFFVVAVFQLATDESPVLQRSFFSNFDTIFHFVQIYYLGPRLILSVRESRAELVADRDAETGASTVAFHRSECTDTLASSEV